MQSRFDLVVVTASERGLSVVDRALQTGMTVALIDVSPQLGNSSMEGISDPFGVFIGGSIESADDLSRWCDDSWEPVRDGFTIWETKGPIAMRSGLTQHHLSRFAWCDEAVQYVMQSERIQSHEGALTYLRQKKFDETWIAHLSHQFASTVFLQHKDSLRNGRALPLFSPYYLRKVKDRSTRNRYDEFVKRGLKLYSPASLVDVSVHGKVLDGVEIRGETAGIVTGRQFVWELSSDETKFCLGEHAFQLFPEGSIEPQWCWLPYVFEIKDQDVFQLFPQAFLILSDAHTSWTHSNFLMVQKVTNKTLRIWLRVPLLQRFQRAYLEKMRNDIFGVFTQRLPLIQMECVQLPPEYDQDFSTIGPTRFPLYSREDRQRLSPLNTSNCWFGGPEHWIHQNLNGRFDHEKQMIEGLRFWWDRELQKRGEGRDQSLQSS